MDSIGSGLLACTTCLALLTSAIFLYYYSGSRSHSVHAPGPRPYPLIGNLPQLPIVRPWLHFTELGRQYGDIVHLSALGKHIVVVNSSKAADDLLNKNSRIFSDRPRFHFISFLGGDFAIPIMPYGDTWRRNRKILHQMLRASEVSAFQPTQVFKAHKLVQALMKDPTNFAAHIRNYIGGLTLHVAYGYHTAGDQDPFLEKMEEIMKSFSGSLIRTTIVHEFPFVVRLLESIPGIAFKEYGHQARKRVSDLLDLPFNFVRDEMAKGVAEMSFASHQLKNTGSADDKELASQHEIIKSAAGNIYLAGTEAMTTALVSFIQAMVWYPEVQKKAQKEIDSIVGLDRLPDFNDRASLTYVKALYREVLRHHPPSPLGVPHAASEDSFYQGYFIPAGTVIVTNIWGMTRDERVYEDPEKFIPERYLTADGELNDDSIPLTFGFGRRECVGRHLAEDILWIAIVSILSTCDICAKIDEAGNDVPIDNTFPNDIVSMPLPFECSITPRKNH